MRALSPVVLCCMFCSFDVTVLARRRIVGGHTTLITKIPYQLSLECKGCLDQYYRHVCGAVIIDQEWALTAAHCLITGRRFRVRAGETYKEQGDVYYIKKTVIHPQYNIAKDDYDIALLKTTKPFVFSTTVQPIALATRSPSTGTRAIVSGWGSKTEGGSSEFTLHKVEVKIISTKRCSKLQTRLITSRMLCAGFIKGGKDSCGGDSGGPLVSNGKLIGIVSWGSGCGEERRPGVYTKVSKFVDWIKQTMNPNAF